MLLVIIEQFVNVMSLLGEPCRPVKPLDVLTSNKVVLQGLKCIVFFFNRKKSLPSCHHEAQRKAATTGEEVNESARGITTNFFLEIPIVHVGSCFYFVLAF